MLDITEIDNIINFELLAENQEINDSSYKDFEALLLAIIASINKNDTQVQTKKIINNSDINENLKEDLKVFVESQVENITGEEDNINFATTLIAGFTFNELIAQRKNTTKKQLTRFMVQAQDAIKEQEIVTQLIKDELNKYQKSIETFYRTQAKSAREVGYARNEKKLETEIKGWMSIAVLDNSTSAICMSLHNKYYEKSEQYKTRFDLPYQIPRHPNCRSMFVAVFKGKSIKFYKEKNLETFLNENEKIGKELMGIEKYRLFKEKGIKLVNFVDLKGRRFYTNGEIKKRLNIK
ncbi:MAG: phage minor head protein [Aliarcobacter butzleri]|nr:phage minor head protein [Aliarcobacter butzleri]